MLHGNEEVMGASSVSGRFLCRHKLSPSVRVKKPGSCVIYATWLKIHLLIVLLAGQAFGQLNSTSNIVAPPTAAQTSVFYFLDFTVDVTGPGKNESEIIAWLDQVFRSELGHCLLPYTGATTTAPTSAQNLNVTEQVATPKTYNSTITAFHTSLQNYSATTNATALNGHTTTSAKTLNDNNTTTAATTLNGDNTRAATALNGNNTTTLSGDNTTTAGTALNGNNTTTFSGDNTTTAGTALNGNNTTMLSGDNTTTAGTALNGNNTTMLSGDNTTTAGTALNGNNTTTLSGDNTTTAGTALNGNNTTTLSGDNTTTAGTALNGNNTTTLSGDNTTTAGTALNGNNTTTLSGDNTTTAGTALNGNNTTTAATLNGDNITSAATVLNGNNATTAAAALNGNITTRAATTQVIGNSTTPTTAAVLHGNTTTAATITVLNENTTTVITSKASIDSPIRIPAETITLDGNVTSTEATATATTTALKSKSLTTDAKSAVLRSNSPTTTTPNPILPSLTSTPIQIPFLSNTPVTTQPPTLQITSVTTQQSNPQIMSSSQIKRKRVARQISDSVTQSSNDTNLHFQVSCSIKTEINHTNCTVLLQLSNRIPSCCILQTLCAASRNSSDIFVVGNRAHETNPLQNECHRNSEEPNSCIYSGPQGKQCVETGPSYVIPAINSTDCNTGNRCNCSSYCNKPDAYYTFSISLQDPTINSSFVSSLISMLTHSPNCSIGNHVTCPSLSIIASEYRSASVDCKMTGTDQSCRVILGFAQEVPVCSVAEAVLNVFLPEEKIHFDGQVSRAAICGSAEVNANSLNVQFTYINSDLKPANFCLEIQGSNFLTCQTGETLLVNLKEYCVLPTTSPNVTVTTNMTSINATTSPNVTSLNATASPNVTSLNATTSPNVTSLNATTSPNVTSLNATASPNVTSLNATASPNVTNLNATASPNVTSLNATASPNVTNLNATASPNVTSLNATASPSVTSLNATASPNVTSLNATASPNVTNLNATASPNVTNLNATASPNVTSLNATASPNVTISINLTTVNPTVQPSNNTLTPTTTPKTQENTTWVQSVNTLVSPAGNGTAESQARELLALTQDVSKLTTAQIEQLVSQLEKLLSGPTVSKELGDISVNIVSNLLDASADKLSSSSDRIIGIVDTVGLKLVIKDTAESLLHRSLAVSVKPADGTNFQETIFSILDPSNVQVRGNPRMKRSILKGSSIPQGSITLPPSLTQILTTEEQLLVSRVQFNFYQKSTVFKDDSLRDFRLNSGILGTSVANLSIKGLQDSVVIRLRNTGPVPANSVAVCVFWDFALNSGSGGWNSSGCFVKNKTDNETVCGCSHLTSFAILLDLSRQNVTSRVQATILTFITYIGCGLSAIFLSITLFTYLTFGKLRKDIPSKILIQLCTALLLLNLVFLVDAWLALYPDAVGLCISTAWFLHYFLLASFTWMGLEGVHMYYALVKVFNDNISHYMLKFSLVGWGVPMIVVIIVIAVDKNIYGLVSYGKFADGTSDEFCWIRNNIAFYVAVVAYFCVIFIFNIIMFIVVLVQLNRIKNQNPHNNKHRSVLQDARSIIGISILLGLSWGFAFFAWGPVNLPFMYLFAIFNSLEGFFIFVFHCAVKETVRRQWKVYLCCGRMRLTENSEWSRTATQKNTKKSPLTSFTSSQGSQPSRSSFQARTPPVQRNGIGNPAEDRIITADGEPSTDVVLNEINRQLRSRRGS